MVFASRAMAITSNGSESLANTMNPYYLTSFWEDVSVFSPFMGAGHAETGELDVVLGSVGIEPAYKASFMGVRHAEMDGIDVMFGPVGSEPAAGTRLASEIDESGERSVKRSFQYGPLTLSPSPLSFAALDPSAAASKFPVLGGDEQQQQQQHQHQQQKRRGEQGRRQGVYVCSRINCGKRFERNNALQRHIVSIHDCKGVLCPFCVLKEKKFNRSDNFMRHVSTAHPSISRDDERLLDCLGELYLEMGRRISQKKGP